MSDYLHHVTVLIENGEAKIEFRCNGDSSRPCHQYPDCECESWAPDHEHPLVAHDECLLKDWFDIGGAAYDGDDADLNYQPTIARSGPIDTEFDDGLLWTWAEA